MAQSSRTTFAKRQKEQARKEKARMKAEKRQQKKSDPGARETDFMDQDGNPIYLDEAGNPISAAEAGIFDSPADDEDGEEPPAAV